MEASKHKTIDVVLAWVVKTIEHLMSFTEESWACSDLALITKAKWLRQLYIFSQNDVHTAFFVKMQL